MRLKDKVIIITGSTMGIGKAIAVRCVEEGARVIVHGLEEDAGRKLTEELGAANAAVLIEDLASETCAASLIERAITTFGRLDAIVNNAAVVIQSNIETTDRALLEKILRVNVVSAFELIKLAFPHLARQKGAVLNIGSINAWGGEPNLFAYSVSKGALMTLTRNLGDTLHREYGVRVNQINPGWVLTEREKKDKREHGLEENWYESLSKLFAPSGRIFTPEEIAACAIYWLGDESGPVSGQVVDIEQHPVPRNIAKDLPTMKKLD